MSGPHEISSAELLSRVERLEAQVRRLSAIATGDAAPPGTGASEWIRYAGRQAAAVEDELKMFGLVRPQRAVDNGRPVIPNSQERR